MVHSAWCMVYGVRVHVYGVWCMVHGAWRMVHGVWCMVHGVWCMVHGAWCMVHGAWCAWCMMCGTFSVSQEITLASCSALLVALSAMKSWVWVSMVGGGRWWKVVHTAWYYTVYYTAPECDDIVNVNGRRCTLHGTILCTILHLSAMISLMSMVGGAHCMVLYIVYCT
jgi:hypothetical protein